MARLKPQLTYGVLVFALLILVGVVALLLRVLFGLSLKDDVEVAETEPQTPIISEEAPKPEQDTEPPEPGPTPEPTATPPPVEEPPEQPPEIDTDADPRPLDPPAVQAPPEPPKPKMIVHAPPPKKSGPPALELTGKNSAAVLVDMRGGLIAYPAGGSSDAYRILQTGGEITVGEKLETWERGRAILQFSDSSLLYIGEQTSLLVEEYSYLPSEPEESRLAVRLITGDARIRTGAIGRYADDGIVLKSTMMRVEVPDADVAVHSLMDGDEIAALGIEGDAPILVTTARTGQALHETSSGRQLVTAPEDLVVHRITDSNKRITVADGFPARAAPMSLSSTRHFAAYTTFYPGAEYTASIRSTTADIDIGRERLDNSAPALRP